jgi:hypothetical protein
MLTIHCPGAANLLRRSRSTGGTLVVLGILLGLSSGCTSTKTSNTARTGTEQLLISNAVDQSLSKVDFRPMAGKKVLIEEKYLESTDKGYVASTVRHHVLQAGGALVAKPEEAEVILEIRSGGIGTDTSDSFLGVPGISLPGMLTLPDVKIVTRTRQSAFAKLGLVAIDAKTHQVLGDGGTTLSMSDDNKWFVMGVGPYEDGSMNREVKTSLNSGWNAGSAPIPNSVVFSRPAGSSTNDTGSSRVQLAAESDHPAGSGASVDVK